MTNRDEKGRFIKGETGNPNGRPPLEFSIAGLLRAEVEKRPQLLKRWADLAESEDENVALKALISLANRIEGMPKQATELTGAGGGPVHVLQVVKSDDSIALG